MTLGLGLQMGGRAIGGAAPSFVFADHAGAKLQWLYESAADLTLDVPPDVTVKTNRIVGELDPVQLSTVNMPHDAGTHTTFGDYAYTKFVMDPQIGVTDYLIAQVSRSSQHTKRRSKLRFYDSDTNTAGAHIANKIYDGTNPNTIQFFDTAALSVGNCGGVFNVEFAGLLGGQQFYGVYGASAGADGIIHYGAAGQAHSFDSIRIGNSSTAKSGHWTAATVFAINTTLSDIENTRDELYAWAVAQGLIL